jgi:TolB protein
MIKLSCKKCGQKLNVEDKHSGKRVKCPKCGSVSVVPDNSDKIKFHCKNCGQSISVPQIHAGKKGKCPKCMNPVVIPSVKKELSKTATLRPSVTSETYEDQYEEESDVSEESAGVDRRLILIISGIAAVVVVGLIILVAILKLSGSGQVEKPVVPHRQEVADTDLHPQPVTSETLPTEPVVREPLIEKALSEEPISSNQELFEGNKIAFASDRDGNYEIYVMNEDGSGLKRLTNNPDEDIFPSWSPDGSKIAFESRRDGNPEIYIMNADGTEQTNLTNNSSWDECPTWSPDGQNIGFHSLRDENHEICVMNPDGSEQKRLTNNSTNDMGPSWSPDGSKIAFFAQRDGNPEIYVMNPEGSEQTRLTNNPARDTGPSWSPDGKITFTSNMDGNYEIYAMGADGSEQKRLTNNPAIDGGACWSSDGKRIAFVSNRDGNREIYIMNADGSEQKRLTNNSTEDRWPCWLPFLASQSRLATVASNESGGLDLKLRIKPKQKLNMRIIEDNNVSQKAMGQSLDIHQTKTTELEFEVEQVDANNIASIKVTYLKFKEKVASQGGQMEYDSTNPEISADNPFAPTYSAMIGQGFIMKVSPEGKILALSGIDEMYLKMAEKIADSEDEDIRERLKERAQQLIDRTNQRYGSRAKRVEALKEMIKKNPLFTEDKFKHIVDIVVVPFPGKSVSIGDSWQEKTILPYGEQFEADGTFILKEKNQTTLTIDISSKIDLNNITVPAMGSPQGQTKITLKGSYHGSLQIKQDSGWMVRKKATFKADGEMKIAVNQQMPQGMTTPMSIKSIVKVEPIE